MLARLPVESAMGLSRSTVDTDRPLTIFDLDTAASLPVQLPARYAVLYTIPPGGDPPDDRLQRLLSMLVPAPQRFVYISTTGVYGDCGGATVTEATPVNPSGERAARRIAAEAALTDWADRSGSELLVLRVPGIYGPGRLGIERLRAGMPLLTERDASPGNRIHVDDLASCCVAALSSRTPAGIYNVGDNDHRSATWFSKEVARQAGLALPPEISRDDANEQFSSARLSFLADSRRVDTTRMRTVLGVVPRYANPVDGIRASLP